jgi:hypothetical protein
MEETSLRTHPVASFDIGADPLADTRATDAVQ